MNCKLLQRISILAAAVIVTLSLFLAFETSPVHADGLTPKKFKSKVVVTTVDYGVWLKMGSKVKKSHKVKVISSNKSVAKPYYEEGFISLWIKKKGKAVITIKNRSTKKTYKCKIIVRKYKNPFRKFAFNGKNKAKKFNKFNMASFKNKKKKAKISVKLKKGWEIKKMTYRKSTFSGNRYVEKTKKIKNNKTIKVRKTDPSGDCVQFIVVDVYNKKSKVRQEFYLDF